MALDGEVGDGAGRGHDFAVSASGVVIEREAAAVGADVVREYERVARVITRRVVRRGAPGALVPVATHRADSEAPRNPVREVRGKKRVRDRRALEAPRYARAVRGVEIPRVHTVVGECIAIRVNG